MQLNPDIFKAYDVRGLYPGDVNEEVARDIGAAFVTYLNAKRIAVGRDMRLSSPALAAAFMEGAMSQGADIVDYGQIATDMLYFAVARDRHDGGVQITASHNPKQYNGMKMVRQEAFPLSGDAGIVEIRRMIMGGTLPRPSAHRGRVTSKDVLNEYVDHVMSFIDPWLVWSRRGSSIGCPARPHGCALRSTGAFPITRRTRSSRKTGRISSTACWPRRLTSASPGTATPTGVFSSTATEISSRAISLRRSWPKRFS
jgi:hypothetical protein